MEVIEFAKSVGNISGSGVIILFLYILYRDGVLSFGKRKNGINGHVAGGKTETTLLSSQMSELKQHYNHETTVLLREIKDSVVETNKLLSEWEKYGAPPPRNK